MTNPDLIARLSEAKEGSRELSDEVLVALGWMEQNAVILQSPDGTQSWFDEPDRPDPTRNLQDVVDLVPGGYSRAVDATMPELGIAVDVYPPDSLDAQGNVHNKFRGDHRDERIATAIAILKAMEARDG